MTRPPSAARALCCPRWRRGRAGAGAVRGRWRRGRRRGGGADERAAGRGALRAAAAVHRGGLLRGKPGPRPRRPRAPAARHERLRRRLPRPRPAGYTPVSAARLPRLLPPLLSAIARRPLTCSACMHACWLARGAPGAVDLVGTDRGEEEQRRTQGRLRRLIAALQGPSAAPGAAAAAADDDDDDAAAAATTTTADGEPAAPPSAVRGQQARDATVAEPSAEGRRALCRTRRSRSRSSRRWTSATEAPAMATLAHRAVRATGAPHLGSSS
eukprot:scaffold2869_cov245-Prasinococcus_capsulatus_cf.AAC.2